MFLSEGDVILPVYLLTPVLGLEGAIEKAHTLLQEALQALEAIPYNTQLLEEFARYVIERKN